jgi:hypothetical protein
LQDDVSIRCSVVLTWGHHLDRRIAGGCAVAMVMWGGTYFGGTQLMLETGNTAQREAVASLFLLSDSAYEPDNRSQAGAPNELYGPFIYLLALYT